MVYSEMNDLMLVLFVLYVTGDFVGGGKRH